MGPNLSEFDDLGHIVTVGNSTSSIGNDDESKISMTGSSIHTEKVNELENWENKAWNTLENLGAQDTQRTFR